MTSDIGLSIGGLAARTGSSVETIRFYERIGMIPRAARRGRYRTYSSADVARLLFIRRSKQLGFSLPDIKALAKLQQSRDESCSDVQALAQMQLAKVRGMIADLRRMEATLEAEIVGCERAVGPECPMLATLATTS